MISRPRLALMTRLPSRTAVRPLPAVYLTLSRGVTTMPTLRPRVRAIRLSGPLALTLGLSGLSVLHAQPQQGGGLAQPRLMTVSPPGGKVGTTLEVGFTGTDLDEPEKLLFSHPGIRAEPVI